MRSEYDFSNAKRAKDVPHLQKLNAGKTRITIMLDNDVLDAFRARAESEGRGYQTAINEVLRSALDSDNAPVTVAALRRELRKVLKPGKAA
ncbi:BrnA antitoxin family protein [Dokdonella soli]|uniref:CopG family transcriptional regulator n=1 Tax=Dokdonella soli TaxID=529810 RepID=A0ABP3U767_9GAMM